MSCTISSFYSFKGGAGRTMALANIAVLLARWGYSVLTVDWDLEAPGLHRYFERWIRRVSSKGLLELVQVFGAGGEAIWRGYRGRVEIPNALGHLDSIRAGSSKDYRKRLQSIDWSYLYKERGLGQFLEQVRDEWKDEYDFVFIDSRTGYTDIGGICTVQMPDMLVMFVPPNNQSLEGSLEVAESAAKQRESLPYDRSIVPVLPIPARIESRVEYEQSQKWLDDFSSHFRSLFAQWLPESVPARLILNHLRLPNIAYWSFGEKLPVLEKGTSDSEDMGYAYATIASVIGQNLEDINLLIENRDDFVRRVETRAKAHLEKGRHGFDLFVSYSTEDAEYARKIVEELRARGLRVFFADLVDRIEQTPERLLNQAAASRRLLLIVGKQFGPWQMAEFLSLISSSPLPVDKRKVIAIVRGDAEVGIIDFLSNFVIYHEGEQSRGALVRNIVREVRDLSDRKPD